MKLKMTFLFCFLTTLSFTQTIFSFKDSQKINPEQYDGIQGNAYFFEAFTEGTITALDGDIYKKVSINYDGFEEKFEVRQEDKFIYLEEKYYKEIVMDNPEGGTVTFVRGVHPRFMGKFVEQLHKSESAILVHKFWVVKSESTVNTVGRTDVLQRFKPQREYYLIKGTGKDDILQLKPNKKKLIQALGYKKELEGFIKKEKLNVTKKDGISTLVKYWESLNKE